MNVSAFEALSVRWRDDAERFRALGQDGPARMSEVHAEELDAALRQWMSESLTVAEAAAESGFSYDRLQHRLAAGSLPNIGTKGAPRIRRCDLPMKGGVHSPNLSDGPDLVGEIHLRRLGG